MKRWRIPLLAAAGFVLCLPALQGSGRDLDYLANARRLFGRFFPPDLSVLPRIGAAFVETAQIAFLATLFAVALALPLGLGTARRLSARPLARSLRLVLAGIRTVPGLVWALIAVAIVGPNPLAGVIALTFYSLGYLGKFYSDALDAADYTVSRTLRRSGAGPFQAFQYGLWPDVKPLFFSHALWMLEYNLRSAAIIGYVGAGGLGVLLHTYQEYGQWDRFCTVLLFIFAVVVALEVLTARLRRA